MSKYTEECLTDILLECLALTEDKELSALDLNRLGIIAGLAVELGVEDIAIDHFNDAEPDNSDLDEYISYLEGNLLAPPPSFCF